MARTLAAALVLGLSASASVMAQTEFPPSRCDNLEPAVGTGHHPQAQPLPMNNCNVRVPADTTLPATGFIITTPENPIFPPSNIVTDPPGSNFLQTVYENYRTPDGVELPNTLPSTPDGKYNLHDGPVSVRSIRRDSPNSDLLVQIEAIERYYRSGSVRRNEVARIYIQNAIDILEGNKLHVQTLPNRAYEGMPLLHYNGPLKRKMVMPIYDPQTKQVIGGNVEVNLVYYGENIESDTSMLDLTLVQEVPWTITYHVNILKNGIEDFSPFVMYFDNTNQSTPLPVRAASAGIAMDQSFFPMLKEGTRYTVKIKQSLGKHWSLAYHWGWRIHPPRVQVLENATKIFPVNAFGQPGRTSLYNMETQVFGVNPRKNQAAKEQAIGMIGDLAPAKRMWNLLRELKTQFRSRDYDPDVAKPLVEDLRATYLDLLTRRRLPRGVEPDPNATLTMLYVNNTIYGEAPANVSGNGSGLGAEAFKGVMEYTLVDWKTRGFNYKVKLLNADKFPHMYVNVDFGGTRGWENQFQFTDPTTVIDEETGETIFPFDRGGTDEHLEANPRSPDINSSLQLGSGCFFTFGRVHYWLNAGPPVGAFTLVGPAQGDQLGSLDVAIHLNHEPSMRLKMYQFDPFHHDVAVFSLH